jgi:hypothetical protein
MITQFALLEHTRGALAADLPWRRRFIAGAEETVYLEGRERVGSTVTVVHLVEGPHATAQRSPNQSLGTIVRTEPSSESASLPSRFP